MKRSILIVIAGLSVISGCSSKQNAVIQPIVIDHLTASGVPAPLGTIKVSVIMMGGLNTGLTYTWTVSNGWAITNGGNTQTATILAALAYSATGTATVTVSYTGHPDLFTTGTIALNTQGLSGSITLAYNAPWPKYRGNMQNTGLSAVNTSTTIGGLKWSFTTSGPIISSPAIGADGTIYIGTGFLGNDMSLIVSCDYGNTLYAINPNGTLKWTFATGCGIISSPVIGSDGTIYVG
ncbi:MAG: PQQ-binding-like beta-propeller repeat protein [Deltaproteobacteria bacterium]|nr:PQQ-binding-like beta-propeller repeat protein [Deltaproteobacteria bacterium]